MPALAQPDVEPLVMRTETRVVDPLRTPGWDDLVGAWPEATPFHTVAWTRVLHRAYGHTPVYLVHHAVPVDGGQWTEDRGQGAGGRSQESGVRPSGKRQAHKTLSPKPRPISHLPSPISDPATVTRHSHSSAPNSDLRTPNSELRTPNSDLRSPNSDLRSPNSDLRTPNSDLRTPNSDLRTPISDLRTPISDLRSPNSEPSVDGAHSPVTLPLSVLPLMEVHSPFTGRRGVALPFTDACPALGEAQETVDGGQGAGDRSQESEVRGQRSEVSPELRSPISDLLALARSRRWRSIEWRGGPPPTPDATPSQSFYSHALDLNAEPEHLFARCSPATRRAVRKAKQAGLEVEIGHTLGTLHEFYALHCRTRRKQGLPPQPFSFFLALHDEIISRGQGFIAVARHGLRPLAAAVFLHFGSRAVYKYGASDDTELPLRANNLVMWQAIRHLASHGFASLDLGRTSLNQDGLRRFKLGWGTTEHILHYYRYCLRTDRFVTVPDRAHGRHNRVFARLPLVVNRLLGAVVYRHLD